MDIGDPIREIEVLPDVVGVPTDAPGVKEDTERDAEPVEEPLELEPVNS